MFLGRPLEEWGLLTAIVTAAAAAIGVAITVVIYVLQQRALSRENALATRKTVVSEVLDAVDRAVRAHAMFPISRFWTKGSLEIVLTLSRLLLALPERDRAAASWVARQVQLMELATTEKQAVRIAAMVGLRLASWHQGDLKTSWFEQQVKVDPLSADLRIPLANRAQRAARETWSWTRLFGGIAVVALVASRLSASYRA